MKNLNLKFLGVIATMFLLGSCQAGNNTGASTEIIASSIDGKISSRDAQIEIDKLISKNKKLKNLTFKDLSLQQREIVVKEIALNKAIYRKGKKINLHKETDYVEALRLFETELLKQKLYIKLVEEARSEESVQAHYKDLVEEVKGKKEVRVRYIALASKKEAYKLYQKIRKRSDVFFSNTAKMKSLDKKTAKKGGDLGFLLSEQLPSEISKAILGAKVGRVLPPISMNKKWIIVRIAGERDVKIASLKKSKKAISNKLAKEAIQNFIKDTLAESEVSIFLK